MVDFPSLHDEYQQLKFQVYFFFSFSSSIGKKL